MPTTAAPSRPPTAVFTSRGGLAHLGLDQRELLLGQVRALPRQLADEVEQVVVRAVRTSGLLHVAGEGFLLVHSVAPEMPVDAPKLLGGVDVMAGVHWSAAELPALWP